MTSKAKALLCIRRGCRRARRPASCWCVSHFEALLAQAFGR